jgi:hypothetical protein
LLLAELTLLGAVITDTGKDLNIYKEDHASPGLSSCCTAADGALVGTSGEVFDVDFNEYTGSFSIYAIKS